MMMKHVLAGCLMALVCYVVVPSGIAWGAVSEARLSAGQTVYVPAYSNVYSGPKKIPFQLATMLSIRSVDPARSLKVTAIDYYDNDGKLIRKYLTAPLAIGPLGTHHIYIEEKDTRGGFGANFIVRWNADRVINVPIIECVMIGGGVGISFVSSGQEIREQLP